MKRFFARQGAHFLLLLGFLLLVSGGFLIVQIFDEPPRHGSAAALETPILPPSVGESSGARPPARPVRQRLADEVKPPLEEEIMVIDLESSVATTSELKRSTAEIADQLESSVVEKLEPVVENLAAKESKKDFVAKKTPAKRQPTASKVAAQSQPEVDELADKPLLVPMTHVKATPTLAQTRPVARKPRKIEIPTQIPPEWDWFSTPLVLEVSEGRLLIVADETGTDEIRLSSIQDSTVEPGPLVVDSHDEDSYDHYEKETTPFAEAVEKMGRRKPQREEEAKKLSVELPSRTGQWKGVPPGLRRISTFVTEILEREVAPAHYHSKGTTPLSSASSQNEISGVVAIIQPVVDRVQVVSEPGSRASVIREASQDKGGLRFSTIRVELPNPRARGSQLVWDAID